MEIFEGDRGPINERRCLRSRHQEAFIVSPEAAPERTFEAVSDALFEIIVGLGVGADGYWGPEVEVCEFGFFDGIGETIGRVDGLFLEVRGSHDKGSRVRGVGRGRAPCGGGCLR